MAANFDLIKDSFADYLSKPYWNWSWYVTATFDPQKQVQYPRLAEHSWRFFLSRIADTAAMSYGWAFAESHKSGSMHWHAIVHVSENLLGQPRRKDIWEAMFKKYGRCEISAFRPTNLQLGINTVSYGVARYLTKYVAKDAATGEAWWDFAGNISGLEADSKQIRDAIGAPFAAIPGQ